MTTSEHDHNLDAIGGLLGDEPAEIRELAEGIIALIETTGLCVHTSVALLGNLCGRMIDQAVAHGDTPLAMTELLARCVSTGNEEAQAERAATRATSPSTPPGEFH